MPGLAPAAVSKRLKVLINALRHAGPAAGVVSDNDRPAMPTAGSATGDVLRTGNVDAGHLPSRCRSGNPSSPRLSLIRTRERRPPFHAITVTLPALARLTPGRSLIAMSSPS